MKKFQKVAVGGTFDELHKGHKTLLLTAFNIGEFVLIGLCSDELVNKMNKPHITASYNERYNFLKDFLKKHNFYENCKIITLNNPYGSTIDDSCIQALVVSQETKPVALDIQKIREQKGLPPIKIITVNMVPSQNCSPISTTRIRNGEIDHEGRIMKK